jgi:hypothetical protein
MRAPALIASGILFGVVVPSAPAAAEPPPEQTCFTYTADQWVSPVFGATTVDCAQPHNGEVLGAVQVPEGIAVTGHASPEVRGWAFRACQPVATAYVWKGGPGKYPEASYVMPRTGRLNSQLPTVEQWAAGERWAACLGQSRNTRLTAALLRAGSIKGSGLKPYVCRDPRTRSWPGTRCRGDDTVRLTNQVWVATSYSQQYPGTGKVLERTRTKCEKLSKRGWTVRSWYVSGAAAWDRGNRFGYCEIAK